MAIESCNAMFLLPSSIRGYILLELRYSYWKVERINYQWLILA